MCGVAETLSAGGRAASSAIDARNAKDVSKFIHGLMSGAVSDQTRPDVILAANWRERFMDSARELGASNLYVTIDLDCLRADEAVTNWENGRFSVDDVAWAISQLRASGGRILGGDICGAYSTPVYARAKQRFAAKMDHPKLPHRDPDTVAKVNLRAFERLWPILTE